MTKIAGSGSGSISQRHGSATLLKTLPKVNKTPQTPFVFLFQSPWPPVKAVAGQPHQAHVTNHVPSEQ